MSEVHFRRTVLLATLFALAACGGAGPKIGSTVKGTRVAVMEQAKSITADKELGDFSPTLNEEMANENWPQAGYEPVHALPNAALPDHLQIAWQANIGKGSSSDFKLLARPVIDQGTIYTLDARGLVRAFNVETGDEKWSFDTTPSDVETEATAGGLGVEGHTLYVTTGFGEVLALNIDDGQVRWRHSLQNPLRAAPTIANNRVYAVTIDNQLSALDAQTGQVLWHHNGIVESATLMGASNPAVEGDSVVVTYSSGEIYDLRAESGRVSWTYTLTNPTQIGALPAIADIRGLPVIDQGHIYAISHSGRMAAIDHRTGDREWETDLGGVNTPVVADNVIYVLSNDGQLVAVQKDSGRIAWVVALQRLAEPDDHDSERLYWTGPVLAGGRLWLTNSIGQLVSFAAKDGEQQEMIQLDHPCYIPPVIAGKTIYIVTDDGTLVALR